MVAELPLSTLDILFVALVIAGFFTALLRRSSLSLPLPPGPKPLPVIGNALHFPTKDPQLKYREWRNTYGDIVHLTAGGKHVVILNTAQATFDLLEKRGRIYSSRPASVMVKMVGLDETWSLLPYGDRLRQFRKLGRQVMSIHAIKKYELIQEEEARFFAKAVLDTPADLIEHLNRVTSNIMLRLLYGYCPSNELDALSTASQKLVFNSAKLITASSRILDLFPFCKFSAIRYTFDFIEYLTTLSRLPSTDEVKHIPAWFPLLSFQQKARDLSKVFSDVFDTPFEAVKGGLNRVGGTYTLPNSLCATLLQDGIDGHPPNSEVEDLIRMFLGSTYPPGQETTSSTLATFFMLMATHPEVQAKARAEIASVVGDHRLPTLLDRHSFVYLQAVLKARVYSFDKQGHAHTKINQEVLRWHSVAPLGLPHCLIEDDEYDGMWIPKDSIVFPNIWEMMHDSEVYPEPFLFRPERFVGVSSKTETGHPHNPWSYVFGFGRRSCPGVHLAEASLLAIMATILATCHIEQCRNSDGSEICIEPKFTPTLVAHLVPFKCSVKPHSPSAMNLLQHALDGARAGY